MQRDEASQQEQEEGAAAAAAGWSWQHGGGVSEQYPEVARGGWTRTWPGPWASLWAWGIEWKEGEQKEAKEHEWVVVGEKEACIHAKGGAGGRMPASLASKRVCDDEGLLVLASSPPATQHTPYPRTTSTCSYTSCWPCFSRVPPPFPIHRPSPPHPAFASPPLLPSTAASKDE